MPLSLPLRTGAALLAAAAALAAPAPASADALQKARASGDLSAPGYALERARSIFRLDAVRARWGAVARPKPHDATGILRDLRLAVPLLRGAEQTAAQRLLARPSSAWGDPFGHGYDPGAKRLQACDEHVCIHWVDTTRDAPPLFDQDASGRPDWVDTSLAVFAEVWAKEIDDLGFRPPLPDTASSENGGDGRLDVYLADIGRQGYFGYCASDDPASWGSERRVSAYCVLDNDFDNPILEVRSPLGGLRVTAAHEFFHAVQFNYDWLEDLWLMEATAVWIEDEVYDAENDSLRYLPRHSPLGQPETPLDTGQSGYEYGAWLFWRFASERLGDDVVRGTWERAVGEPYSLAATRRTLAASGTSLTALFARFGVANRTPSASYRDGRLYPASAAGSEIRLGGATRDTGALGYRVRHLASRTVSFRPAAGLDPSRLTVAVSVPRRFRTTAATLVVVRQGRDISRLHVWLGRKGAGRRTVAFGGAVRRVDLVLSNAGGSFACWRGTGFSCQGVSRDDNRLFRVRASL